MIKNLKDVEHKKLQKSILKHPLKASLISSGEDEERGPRECAKFLEGFPKFPDDLQKFELLDIAFNAASTLKASLDEQPTLEDPH